MLLPLGNCFCAAAVIFAISPATPPRSRPWVPAEDVDDSLNVVVSHYGWFLAPAHRRQIF